MGIWGQAFIENPLLIPEDARAMMLEIEQEYGDTVYFQGRRLIKFGATGATIQDTDTVIMDFATGDGPEETQATGNTIDSIISDDSADDGKVVLVEGHFLRNNHLNFFSQQATLGDLTRTALSQNLIRATRIARPRTGGNGPLAGNIYVYDNTIAQGATSGTPNNLANGPVKVMVTAGRQQSRKAATAISHVQYYGILYIESSFRKGSGGTARDTLVELEQKQFQETAWQPLGIDLNLNSQFGPLIPPTRLLGRIIRPDTDIRAIANASAANLSVNFTMAGYLFSKNKPTGAPYNAS